MGKQFLNSMYKRKSFTFDPTQNKRVLASHDALIYTIKDTETNETELKILPEPEIDFYVANTKQTLHRFSIPKEEVFKKTVKFADRDKELATAVNMKTEFYDSFKNRTNYEFMDNLKNNPYLYMADVHIEDFYKTFFMFTHGKNYGRIKKAYMDIEVDISHYVGFPMPDVAPCEINLISYIDETSKTIYSFILIQSENKDQILAVKNDTESFTKEYVAKDIQDEFTIKYSFYDKELDLLIDFFNIVHGTKPDFVGIWNMNFDMKTILKRFSRLGCDKKAVANIMCHPEVPEELRYVDYIEEPGRNGGGFATKTTNDDEEDEEDDVGGSSFMGKHPSRYFDWVEIPGYSQFYDQMSLFSNLRKRDVLPTYKLDAIGEEFAGTNKVDLESLGYSIKDVNIKNFKVFLGYNIQDTVVQYKIEKAQEDLDKYILFADNTRLCKGVSVSNIIKNMIMYYLWENGEVIGNSVRYNISEKLPGAIVARPELIDQLGNKVLGNESFVFSNAIDLDAASEYPSIMIIFNITKSAIYGRVTEIKTKAGQQLSDGVGVMEKLQTINYSVFDLAKQYLGLPNTEDLIKQIEKGVLNEIERRQSI